MERGEEEPALNPLPSEFTAENSPLESPQNPSDPRDDQSEAKGPVGEEKPALIPSSESAVENSPLESPQNPSDPRDDQSEAKGPVGEEEPALIPSSESAVENSPLESPQSPSDARDDRSEAKGPVGEEEPALIPSSESAVESSPLESPQNPSDARDDQSETKGPVDRGEIFRALETVERDSAAIAESFASLFSSLRLALSEVTSTSVENMQCFSDIVGSIQESALDAATKGNRYINSCLRLNEELKGMESLSMQLKILRKNVDALDVSVNRLLRLP